MLLLVYFCCNLYFLFILFCSSLSQLAFELLRANSFDDLISLLNKLPESIKSTVCNHLLNVTKDYLKTYSSSPKSKKSSPKVEELAKKLSEINLNDEDNRTGVNLEQDSSSAKINNGSQNWKIESKVQVLHNQKVDNTFLNNLSIDANQTMDISKTKEDVKKSESTTDMGNKSECNSPSEYESVEDSHENSDEDYQSADEKSQDDMKAKLEAFHERIGYSYHWPELAAEAKAKESKPSPKSPKAAEKPKTFNVKSPKKKTEVVSKANCPETTKNVQTFSKTVEKSENGCLLSKPKIMPAAKSKIDFTASTFSFNFSSDSIFASTEFSNFFSDLNISINTFSSQSTSDH